MTTPLSREDERLQQLYDVTDYVAKLHGGVLIEDPYPEFAMLRAQAPVHRGSVASLLGLEHNPTFHPELEHFSVFDYATSSIVLRDSDTFSSTYYTGKASALLGRTILEMGGEEHRRYRGLMQSGFVPKLRDWWIDNWIQRLVDDAITLLTPRGSAELNADLCARIPLHTITGSFGIGREDALRFRELFGDPTKLNDPVHAPRAFGWVTQCLQPVIDARRTQPGDDLITKLVHSEITESDVRHRLSDDEVLAFARLLLTAGSGTTWRQLGILLTALLTQPGALDRVRADRTLVPRAIEESLRWEPTDPIFRRLTTTDVELGGVQIPAGSVIEVNLGAANRDPQRWDDPDQFQVDRKPLGHLAFATGPHVCLGQHVTRAEMTVALEAVLDRLPNVHLDEDAPPPRIVGLEHRGPTPIHVIFG